MHQIRMLLRQKLQGWSNRKIERETGISRTTLKGYLRKLNAEGCSIEDALKLSEESLGRLLWHSDENTRQRESNLNRLHKRFETIHSELRRVGVTRLQLWKEYREEEEDGYGYSQFCEHYKLWSKTQQVVAHFEHQPGKQLMADYAGKKLSYIDRDTGQVIPCPVLVTVLPYSGMSYVEAAHSQQQEDLICCLTNSLKWIGGVPESLLTDNLKSAVQRADRYEPTFTELMEQFASFYGFTATATRVRKPRDKAMVENAVKLTYQQIYAKMRKQEFYSLKELNGAIRNHLDAHLDALFQNRSYSRRMLFEENERQTLSPLPHEDFILKKTAEYKVQKNYHVMLGEDKHFYSVPYMLVGQKVRVIYTREAVEIYHNFNRVAVHYRDRSHFGYTTERLHMPENHQHEAIRRGWDAAYFRRQAQRIGPDTAQAIDMLLERRIFKEQTYNSCLGVLRLGGKYGHDRLEAACRRAVKAQSITYRMLKNILERGLDMADAQLECKFSTPDHDNIRGPQQYQ